MAIVLVHLLVYSDISSLGYLVAINVIACIGMSLYGVLHYCRQLIAHVQSKGHI
jgi:hypothetical protein